MNFGTFVSFEIYIFRRISDEFGILCQEIKIPDLIPLECANSNAHIQCEIFLKILKIISVWSQCIGDDAYISVPMHMHMHNVICILFYALNVSFNFHFTPSIKAHSESNVIASILCTAVRSTSRSSTTNSTIDIIVFIIEIASVYLKLVLYRRDRLRL